MTIRKSEEVDSAELAAHFNCTRCRLEMVWAMPGQPAQQAILRVCRLEIAKAALGQAARQADVLHVCRLEIELGQVVRECGLLIRACEVVG